MKFEVRVHNPLGTPRLVAVVECDGTERAVRKALAAYGVAAKGARVRVASWPTDDGGLCFSASGGGQECYVDATTDDAELCAAVRPVFRPSGRARVGARKETGMTELRRMFKL